MSTATFVSFRHRTSESISDVDLPDLSNHINRAISYKIEKGDTFRFSELNIGDQLAIKRIAKAIPSEVIVIDIEFEPNLEIKNGIKRIYLEGRAT
jgi:hypothetical protein